MQPLCFASFTYERSRHNEYSESPLPICWERG